MAFSSEDRRADTELGVRAIGGGFGRDTASVKGFELSRCDIVGFAGGRDVCGAAGLQKSWRSHFLMKDKRQEGRERGVDESLR